MLPVQIQIQNSLNSQIMSNLTLVKDLQNFEHKWFPSKFIFLKVMPRDNFSELLEFFPKSLVPSKNQTKFISCFLPKFLIQNPFGIWICAQKECCSFLFIMPPQIILVICGVWEGQFCHFTNCTRGKKFELISDWVGPNWQPDQHVVRSLSMTVGPAC
jgi:hypothetical protein